MQPGPLGGLRVVEFAAIGPVPFAVMLLSQLGAEVLTIGRSDATWPPVPIIAEGRAELTLDLKQGEGREAARAAMALADVVVEGFRPGVMERLGLGPEAALEANPRLVYARMTGWGQDGPLARTAGHDINYIALTGLLDLLGQDGRPPDAPLNFVGDYAGGSLFLVVGVLAALMERQRSGRGQVVDAAIVDGAASLLSPILGMMRAGLLDADPSKSLLAGRMPYYRTYRCGDSRDIAVGALEDGFRAVLTGKLGLEPGALDGDPVAASERLAAVFAAAPRDHWTGLFAGADACVTPVLTLEEARRHPHLAHRAAFVEDEEGVKPAPAPRFSRTPGRFPEARTAEAMLAAWRAAPLP
jgi:alpha-methylacyl-CoA racemase